MRAAILAAALLVAAPAEARPPPVGLKLVAAGVAALAVGLTLIGVGAWAYSSASSAPTLEDFNLRKSLADTWELGAGFTAVGTGLLISGAVSAARERRIETTPSGVTVRF